MLPPTVNIFEDTPMKLSKVKKKKKSSITVKFYSLMVILMIFWWFYSLILFRQQRSKKCVVLRKWKSQQHHARQNRNVQRNIRSFAKMIEDISRERSAWFLKQSIYRIFIRMYTDINAIETLCSQVHRSPPLVVYSRKCPGYREILYDWRS